MIDYVSGTHVEKTKSKSVSLRLHHDDWAEEEEEDDATVEA